MNAIEVLGRAVARPFRASGAGMTLNDLGELLSMNSPLFSLQTTLQHDRENIEGNFAGLVRSAYQRNGLVFACLATRAKLFAEARFQFQQMFGGHPGALFGTPDLAVLERPEPGITTGDMLFRASLYADLGGDWFGVRRDVRGESRIKALRPDWTTVVLGSRNPNVKPEEVGWDVDTEVVGFGYLPGGPGAGTDPVAFGPEEVAHYFPNPDPLARYRGAPLIVSVLRDILADSEATNHKLAFFRNSGTPNIALTLPASMDEEKARKWIQAFEGKHAGVLNAYKTLYFGGGIVPTPLGNTFQQMTFTELQQAAESRLVAATGMHRVVLGLSEGGGALNGPNFGGVARLVGDITLRPMWRNMSGSLETIVPPRPATRIWTDDRDIAFLRADVKDQAEIQQSNATTITTYVKDGFTPQSAIDTVVSGDPTRLVHTGLVSVQLQPPGASLPAKTGAETFYSVPAARLRQLLAAGYTPASGVDEEVVRRALQEPSIDQWAIPGPASFRATTDFWATEGSLVELGTVRAGAILPAGHPLVRKYPALFVPADDAPVVTVSSTSSARRLTAGPAPIVSRAAVLAKRVELEAAGRDAGYDTLATELGVSRDTIRRRLNGS